MNPVAILPIKSFDKAKRRLAEALGTAPRQALVEAMFADVLVALRRATRVDSVIVVTNDRVAGRIADGYGTLVVHDDEDGHNQAAARGVRRAIELGAERALLVPGDCPLLDPGELDALIATELGAPSVIVVPDRHGTGTNALLISPPDALTPAFGLGSRARHEQLARDAGIELLTVPVPSLALDVDTPDDLAAIEAALRGARGGAAHTRGMVRQFERMNARP